MIITAGRASPYLQMQEIVNSDRPLLYLQTTLMFIGTFGSSYYFQIAVLLKLF